MQVQTDLKFSPTEGPFPLPSRVSMNEDSDSASLHPSSRPLFKCPIIRSPLSGVCESTSQSCALAHGLHVEKSVVGTKLRSPGKSNSNHSFAQAFHPVHTPPPSLQHTMRSPTIRRWEESSLFSDLILNSLFSKGFSSLSNSL